MRAKSGYVRCMVCPLLWKCWLRPRAAPAAVALRRPNAAANAAFGRFVKRAAKHDVEIRGELADLGRADRFEIDEDRFQGERVANAAGDHVAVVLGVAIDEDLRGQHAAAVLADGNVDVRRAARIGHGLDRAEVILALRISQESTVALKILVVTARAGISGVNVVSV